MTLMSKQCMNNEYLMGQSNETFDHHFFHNSSLSEPLTNELKYFWLRIRQVIRILVGYKLTPQGTIPRGVKIFLNTRSFLK